MRDLTILKPNSFYHPRSEFSAGNRLPKALTFAEFDLMLAVTKLVMGTTVTERSRTRERRGTDAQRQPSAVAGN